MQVVQMCNSTGYEGIYKLSSAPWTRCRGSTQPWQGGMDSQLTTCCTGCREGGPGNHLARRDRSQQRQGRRRRASSGRHSLRLQKTSRARGPSARTHACLRDRLNSQRRQPPWNTGRGVEAQQHQGRSGTGAQLHTGAIRCAPDLPSGLAPCPYASAWRIQAASRAPACTQQHAHAAPIKRHSGFVLRAYCRGLQPALACP